MTECKHIYMFIEADSEGDEGEGPEYVNIIPAHRECILCGDYEPDEED